MINSLAWSKYLRRTCLTATIFGILLMVAVGQEPVDKVSMASFTIELVFDGDYALVVKDLDEAIQADPKRADAYALRARAYYLWNKKEQAEKDADKALSLNPKEPTALNIRGIIKRERKDYDGAITDLTNAIAADPQAFKPFYNRGMIYAVQQKYESAVADLSKALDLAKTDDKLRIYKERAQIYETQNNFAAAIADYTESIKLSPKDAILYGRRGNVYLNSIQNDLAVRDYQKSLEIEPSNAAVKANLSKALVRRKYLKAGAKIDSAASDAAYDAGNEAYDKRKDYAAAVKYYTDCINAMPIADACYTNRADANRKLEKYDEAIADYNIAVELNPDSAKNFGNRGFSYFRKKDYQAAIKDYDRAIALSQTEPYYYLNRGASYANLGKPADGEADIKKALQMLPHDQSIKDAFDNLESQLHPSGKSVINGGGTTEESVTAEQYFNRGGTQIAAKQFEAAVQSYSGCLRLEPTNYSCYYQRAVAYDNFGKTAEAIADVNKTLELEPTYALALNAKAKLDKRLAQAKTDEATKIEYARYRNEYDRLSDLDAAQGNEMIAEYKKRTGANLDTDYPSSVNAAQKSMVCGYLVKMKPLEEQIEQQKQKLEQIKAAGKLAGLPDLAKDLENLEDDEAYDPQLVDFLYEPLGCHQP